jgi:hypothetical protein
MKLLQLLDALGEADNLAPAARRAALQHLSRTAAKALPLAFGTLALPASAQRTGTTLDGLLLALRLERLEQAFYTRAIAANPSNIAPELTLLQTHETQHVARLETIIRDSGASLPAAVNYDFTGSRNGTQAAVFGDVLTNVNTLLAVAQVLEDAGVRAYKAALPLLISDNDLLETGMRIHAVEARHAAHIRGLRRSRGASVKNWISKTDGGGPTGTPSYVYEGEDRVTQPSSAISETKVTSLPRLETALKDLTDKDAPVTEAFDEALDTASIEKLLTLFTY